MKKVYESPKMMEEVVCVEEPLAASLPVFDGDDALKVDDNSQLLGKDRDDNDFGGLW